MSFVYTRSYFRALKTKWISFFQQRHFVQRKHMLMYPKQPQKCKFARSRSKLPLYAFVGINYVIVVPNLLAKASHLKWSLPVKFVLW